MTAPAKDGPADEEWHEAMIMVAGIDRDALLGLAQRDRPAAVKEMWAAYEICHQEGLMDKTTIDGEDAYRLSDRGLDRLAWLEGAIIDGQHRGAL